MRPGPSDTTNVLDTGRRTALPFEHPRRTQEVSRMTTTQNIDSRVAFARAHVPGAVSS